MSRSHADAIRLIRHTLVALVAVAAWVAPLGAQEQSIPRAIPPAVKPPAGYMQALDRGWRSTTGAPGAGYWQQEVDYDIEAKLDPDSARLTGTVQITYVNHAPLSLPAVWLYLHQDFHKEGVARHVPAEITEGFELARVSAQGQDLEDKPLTEGPAYQVVSGDLLQVRTPAPVAQGDTLRLEIEYAFTVPEKGINGRMGHSSHEVYMMAYWFPKMAVLDDLRNGNWDVEPFLGSGEFYDEFGDYSVAITVPEDWTVMATGDLQNADSVYSAVTQDLLAAAAKSDTLVTIAGQAERDAKTVTTHPEGGLLTYRYTAENVRDFVWTTSNTQRWDAASAVVPDRNEDGDDDRVLIHSFWRPDRAPVWSDAWLYAKQSVERHSRFTGFSYPWSHMALVEGADIILGGMEYPMMTLIAPFEGQDGQALFNTVSHEIAHMWIPMIVGTNERRYAWMDEGSANFIENESRMELWPGVDHRRVEARQYLELAAAGQEQSMMRHADWYEPGNGFTIASYQKPAALLVALREVIGSVLFDGAYKAFISEWAYKHPTPWDFFNTFERFAGKDLDWFWSAFYYETWSVDHAVRTVQAAAGGGQTVVIEDRGTAPFPTTVRIRTSSGNSILEEVPVEHWLAGNTTYEISVPADAGRVTRVDLDPDGYVPDVDRQNDFWPRG